jgi:hypothetical protein
MICFHRTTTAHAEQILRDGFKDNPTTKYRELAGIWLSEGTAYTVEDGAKGDAVLAVKIPAKVFRKYDAGENGGVPASCVPAKIINQYRVYAYDHDSSGIGREKLLGNVAALRECGYKDKADYFEYVVLPFLERYDLLDKEGPF